MNLYIVDFFDDLRLSWDSWNRVEGSFGPLIIVDSWVVAYRGLLRLDKLNPNLGSGLFLMFYLIYCSMFVRLQF